MTLQGPPAIPDDVVTALDPRAAQDEELIARDREAIQREGERVHRDPTRLTRAIVAEDREVSNGEDLRVRDDRIAGKHQ